MVPSIALHLNDVMLFGSLMKILAWSRVAEFDKLKLKEIPDKHNRHYSTIIVEWKFKAHSVTVPSNRNFLLFGD